MSCGNGDERRYTLAQYVLRVDLYGAECVIQTARELGLPGSELQELAGYIAHKERTCNWTRGQWVPKPGVANPRQCEGCGLDLVAQRRRRFHDAACQKRAARARSVRERDLNPSDRTGGGSVA